MTDLVLSGRFMRVYSLDPGRFYAEISTLRWEEVWQKSKRMIYVKIMLCIDNKMLIQWRELLIKSNYKLLHEGCDITCLYIYRMDFLFIFFFFTLEKLRIFKVMIYDCLEIIYWKKSSFHQLFIATSAKTQPQFYANCLYISVLVVVFMYLVPASYIFKLYAFSCKPWTMY